MAEAHGKLTGQPGIAMVTRGDQGRQMLRSVYTRQCRIASPMVLFVGQIATWMRDREAFQEIDYRAFFGPIAKWAVEVDDACAPAGNCKSGHSRLHSPGGRAPSSSRCPKICCLASARLRRGPRCGCLAQLLIQLMRWTRPWPC